MPEFCCPNLPVWLWSSDKAAASWHFVTLPVEVSDEIKAITAGVRHGFGSVKITATIGETTWETSLFPSKEENAYLLPLKKAVRVSEKFDISDRVTVTLAIRK